MIQCATCINETAAIDALHPLWPEQEEFNRYYGKYQDAARGVCCDYMKAFA